MVSFTRINVQNFLDLKRKADIYSDVYTWHETCYGVVTLLASVHNSSEALLAIAMKHIAMHYLAVGLGECEQMMKSDSIIGFE